jgi:prepilin-type processing-associated H-X9-DG protein
VRPGLAYFAANPPPALPAPTSTAEAVQKFDNWGYRLGGLYRYAPNADLLHCPADIRYKRGALPAWASYSGIHGIGKGSPSERLTKITQVRKPSDRALFVEESDSRSVSYGGFTFGENLGTWSIRQGNAPPKPSDGISGNPDQTGYSVWGINSWYDAPAAFHGRSSSFSFLDGHAVSRRWIHQDTIRFANDPVWGRQNAPRLIMGRDLNFIVLAYPSPLNP